MFMFSEYMARFIKNTQLLHSLLGVGVGEKNGNLAKNIFNFEFLLD